MRTLTPMTPAERILKINQFSPSAFANTDKPKRFLSPVNPHATQISRIDSIAQAKLQNDFKSLSPPRESDDCAFQFPLRRIPLKHRRNVIKLETKRNVPNLNLTGLLQLPCSG